MHALPVSVYGQTDFTPKPVFVSRLRDTVESFRTRVRFSPRYNNRGELTPAWHFVVVSCLNKCRAISIADFPDGRNLSFHLLGNDRRPSQKSGTRWENRNGPNYSDLSPSIPDDRGYLRFRVFISQH